MDASGDLSVERGKLELKENQAQAERTCQYNHT